MPNTDEVIDDDDRSTLYFYNITDNKLELALDGGVAFIEEGESGEVTFLKFNDMKATIDVVQWKTKPEDEEKTNDPFEVPTLRSYSFDSRYMS